MSETLAARVKRIISGSMNDLIDQIETANAERVMREAVRELDRTMDDVRHELGKVMATRHQTSRRLERNLEKITEMTQKAALAIDKKRDELAEAAIALQLDLEAQIPVLEKSLVDLSAKQTEFDAYLAALKGRKSEMESELTTFAQARAMTQGEVHGADPRLSVCDTLNRRVDKAQDAFDRALSGASGLSGQARADREQAAKLHELDRVSRSSAIADRLIAIKTARTGT